MRRVNENELFCLKYWGKQDKYDENSIQKKKPNKKNIVSTIISKKFLINLKFNCH